MTTTTETLGYRPRVMLTFDHLCKMFGCKRDAIYDYCHRGIIPQPVKLGVSKQAPLRWYADEVEAALAKLPRARLKPKRAA